MYIRSQGYHMVHGDRGPEKRYLEGAEETLDQSGRVSNWKRTLPDLQNNNKNNS